MSASWFEEWITRAEEDYRAATALGPSEVPCVTCFHSQQCVEKYLKAALVKYNVEPSRTHNLIVLGDMVSEHDERFTAFGNDLSTLNPYSVLPRYPGIETTPENAKQALAVASRLRHRIRALLDLEQKE